MSMVAILAYNRELKFPRQIIIILYTPDTPVQSMQCEVCSLKADEKAPRRKIKIGEELEVSDFPPQFRMLALELPRSYREKALAHFHTQAIDLSDPSDWEADEVRKYLITQSAIYQRKASHMKAHSERRRVAAWEARQLEATPTDDADESVPPEPEALARDPIQYAVDRVVKLVNKKLLV